MLKAVELSAKINEYRSLLWIKQKYSRDWVKEHFKGDLTPAVFHQMGAAGIANRESLKTLSEMIRSTALKGVETQIAILEGEFEMMKISLEGIKNEQ